MAADHDWGLQAVIRSKEHDHDHDHDQHQQNQHHYNNQDELFGSIDMKKEYDQALIFCYPHLFDDVHHHDEYDLGGATTSTTIVATDELDQLYKPFYNHLPAAAAAAADQEMKQDQEQKFKNSICGSGLNTSKLAPKLKKRKNQQKRVVEVTADGLSADPWAWRKYGQKPIKGSIYPRSYYRCSSSKGCMARRQVEQSYTDSSIYILTYTAEHNHPQPTRRNSLAGINRGRFKATPKSPATTSDNGKTITIAAKDSPFHSPTTLSISSIEDEVLEELNVKQEISEDTLLYNKFDDQGHTMMPAGDDYMVFSDDFFEGLDDLGGYKMDSSSCCNSSAKQFSHVFC